MVICLLLVFVLFVIGSCTSDQHIGLLMCVNQCSEIHDCFMIAYYQQTLVCKKQRRGNIVKNNSNVLMIEVKYKGCDLENSCGVGSSSVKNRRNACVCLQNSELDEAIMLTSKADVISTRNKFNKQRQVENRDQLLRDLKGREFHNQSKSNLATKKLKMTNTTTIRVNQNTTEQIHMRTNTNVNKEENHNQRLKQNSKTIDSMNITSTREEVLNQRIMDPMNTSVNKTKEVRHMKMTMEKKEIKTNPRVNNQSNDDVKKKMNTKTMDHTNMSKTKSNENKEKAKAIMDKMNIKTELSVGIRGEYNLKMKSKPRPLKQVDMERKRAEKVAQSLMMKGKKSNYNGNGAMGQTPKTKHQGNEANTTMGPNNKTGDQIHTERNEALNKLRNLLISSSIRNNKKMRKAQRRDLVNSRRQEDNINLKPNPSTRDQGDQRYTRRNGDGGNKQMRARIRDQMYTRRNEDTQKKRNPRTRDQTYRGRNEDTQMRPNPRTRDQTYRGRNEDTQMRPNPRTRDQTYRGRNKDTQMRPNPRTRDQTYRGRNKDNQMRRNPRTSDKVYRGRNEDKQMRPNPRSSDQLYRSRNEDNRMRKRAMNVNNADMRQMRNEERWRSNYGTRTRMIPRRRDEQITEDKKCGIMDSILPFCSASKMLSSLTNK